MSLWLWRVRDWLGTLALGLLTSWAVGVPAAVDAKPPSPIPYPAGLEAQVQFWKDVFTIYSTKHVVIHDRESLDRVYAVIDFTYLDTAGVSPVVAERVRRERVQDELERIRGALLRIHQAGPNSPSLSAEEQRIARFFPAGTSRRAYREAAAKERLRAQTGLSEKFHKAIEVAHGYWPAMERIFRDEGLPVELTRLPLVESGFDLTAYSRTGAAGIWQFMPATGRMYMRIDDAVDERRDPIVATRAAAQHLRENYEVLGTWPLALTAYNHGRGGMVRAVSQVGTTDIVEIIRRYNGRTFGFASRNFYAEFLAALEAEREAVRYFGALQPQPRRDWKSARVPDYVRLSALARSLGVPVDALARMNPALSRRVVSGELYVPRGYELWMQPAVAAKFDRAYASLSAAEKHGRQKRSYVEHRVRPGDTLGRLAQRYGTTISAIMRQNGLRNANQIRIGQTLRIPTRPSASRSAPKASRLVRDERARHRVTS